MLVYYIDKNDKPLYIAYYNAIKNDILSGRLKDGDKLPSKREFAYNNRISLITVETAYRQLEVEGYIYTVLRKGYFVNKIDSFHKEINERKIEEDDIHTEYLIDLSTSGINDSSFPLSVFNRLSRSALNTDKSILLHKTDNMGYVPLRKAIARHLLEFSNLDVSYKQILIGAGSEYLYNMLIQLLGKDKIYATEDPGHKAVSNIYKANGLNYQYLNIYKEGVDIDELIEKNVDVALLSINHHFPSGITTPVNKRYRLLKWAKEYDGIIIEDDYDSEYRQNAKPIPSLFSLDENDRVIYLNTFSKTLAPSFRISYCILPVSMLEKYKECIGFYSSSVSILDQIILEKFISEGYFLRHISSKRTYYRKLREKFIRKLSEIENITIKEENAGLHFLLEYKSKLSDKQIIEKAEKLSLKISSLSSYSSKEEDLHTLIINYSGLKEEDIDMAVKLLKDTLKE